MSFDSRAINKNRAGKTGTVSLYGSNKMEGTELLGCMEDGYPLCKHEMANLIIGCHLRCARFGSIATCNPKNFRNRIR